MMAYFNPDEVDALSLQDMIDCDIKTEIESMLHFQNSEKLSSLDYCLQQINGCDVGTVQNNNNLEYVPIDEFNKIAWGSEAERLHQLVEVENTDPNLLVNPQTGMPIHHQQHPSNVMDSDSASSIQHVSMNNQLQGIITVTAPQYISGISVINSGINSNSPLNTPLGLNTVNIGGQHHIHHTYAQGSLNQHQIDNGNLHIDSGMSSPSQTNPVLLEQLQSPIGMQSPRKLQCVTNTHVSNASNKTHGGTSNNCSMDSDERVFPKPAYSYSCLIAMALKNSKNGSLPVSEIYDFMTSNFPYFKTAPDGWKNSVRHNLSLNKCFEKVDNPNNTGNTRKGCLWGLNPAKVEKMEEEIVKWRKKDPETVKNSMANPEDLELIESGRAGSPNTPQRRPSQSSDTSDITAGQTMHLLRMVEEPRVKPKTVAEILNGDMNGLDSSLTLDPVLSELASQSGLWDDDLPGDLKLDVPFSSSPLTICNSPLTSHPSPLTVCLPTCDGMIQGSYVYSTTPYHLDQSPASKHITIYTQTPTRPLSAQT